MPRASQPVDSFSALDHVSAHGGHCTSQTTTSSCSQIQRKDLLHSLDGWGPNLLAFNVVSPPTCWVYCQKPILVSWSAVTDGLLQATEIYAFIVWRPKVQNHGVCKAIHLLVFGSYWHSLLFLGLWLYHSIAVSPSIITPSTPCVCVFFSVCFESLSAFLF